MRTAFLSALCAASLSACAQSPAPEDDATPGAATEAAAKAPTASVQTTPGTPEDRARQAIESINPKIAIDRIGPAPLPGFREVIVGGQVLYITDDGRYLLQGGLYDVAEKRDLGQASLAAVRKKLVDAVPEAERIVFAPANPKYTVSVFTDIECGYCRKLHEDIAEYNKRGIAVEYLAFPRQGLGSPDFNAMVSVWCSPDRKRALTDAKAGKRVPPRTCDNPVTRQYELGQRIGLTGTPMILAEDGTQMPGYLPPDALLAALQALSAAPTRHDAPAAGG
ncbi:MAG: thioredoxin fold domain-containing protein [Proteobacteria bacterium]|nr:thioredoxin fold domain-containing protein [Pseudomonadota bacterium]